MDFVELAPAARLTLEVPSILNAKLLAVAYSTYHAVRGDLTGEGGNHSKALQLLQAWAKV